MAASHNTICVSSAPHDHRQYHFPPLPSLHDDQQQAALVRLIDHLWFCENVLTRPQLSCGEPNVLVVDQAQAQPDPGVCAQLITSSNSRGVGFKKSVPEPEQQKKSLGDVEQRVGRVGQVEEVLENLNLDRQFLNPHVDRPSVLHQENQVLVKYKKQEYSTVPETGFSSHKEFNRPLISRTPQLDTIDSGKQLVTEGQPHLPLHRRRRPQQRKRTRSLTDIEYDEVKGFRELGFNFSEDELTPRMVKLVPGLRPLSRGNSGSLDSQFEAEFVHTVYPPDDWWEGKAEPPRSPKWKIPSPQQGIDMKEQLKFWAHAVASNVRQEC